MWEPSFLAILRDPWRSRVHVGSVGSLIRQGLLYEEHPDVGLAPTAAGLAVLAAVATNSKAQATFQHRGVLVEIHASGFTGDERSQLVASRTVDLLRLLTHDEPATWEATVDLALAERESPLLITALMNAVESVDPTGDEPIEVDILVTALSPAWTDEGTQL